MRYSQRDLELAVRAAPGREFFSAEEREQPIKQ
jgi:hypothetical protein